MHEKERSRLEAFRQLKQQIRGSKEHLIVGIDVAKEKHTAFFGTATGRSLWRRLVFGNDREGFERLLVQAQALQAQHGLSKVVYGLEPTANYHKPLGGYLIERGEMVVLVSNAAVKHNRTLLDGRWDKHDVKDCANVADLISQGKCLFYEYPEKKLRELRGLLSLKRRLRKQEHGVKMRIRNQLVAQYFPELDRYMGGSESLAIVRWCLDPSVIGAADYEEFEGWVAPRIKNVGQRRRLRAIWQKAAESVGCPVGEGALFEAEVMVEGLKELREVIKETEARIEQLCVEFAEYAYLRTIPGFGPQVSAMVLGGIGNPFRFRRHQEVLKLAGLDLSAQRSGKRSEGITPVLSKKGKAELRYALYQAAMIASSKNRDFVIWFTRRLRARQREKGIRTKMRVKLSAKLLTIAWTLMKKKEAFDPKHLHLE